MKGFYAEVPARVEISLNRPYFPKRNPMLANTVLRS